jgi:hypothetical protein
MPKCYMPTLDSIYLSIYIKEEVLSKSGKADRSILQLSFHDNEGHHWLLPFGRYRALGLNIDLMDTCTNLVFKLGRQWKIIVFHMYFVKRRVRIFKTKNLYGNDT